MSRLLLSLLFIVTFISTAYSEWTGPVEVLSGSWGYNDDQFGFTREGSFDGFPRNFGITSEGKFVIGDTIQDKIKVYSSNGDFLLSIQNPTKIKGYVDEIDVGGKCVVVGFVSFTHTFDVNTGQQVADTKDKGGAKYVSDDCNFIYTTTTNSDNQRVWRKYTPQGKVLLEQPEKPVELGMVKKGIGSNKEYKFTVSFPDKTWKIESDSWLFNFVKVSENELYATCDTKECVYVFDQSGSLIDQLDMPPDIFTEHETPVGAENIYSAQEEYGTAYIAKNGDVYTWKRTPNKYSILKWQRD